ncbi:MAG: AI-2E family transporter [Pseudobacteriovorax sp.]|nr:AI-2E family transporter [Pseudobacteriovorax sp.]
MANQDALYDWKRFKRFVLFSSFVFLGILAVAVLYRTIVVALAVSLIFTYVLSPAVNRVLSIVKISRPIAVLILVALVFGAGLGLAAALIPTVYGEMETIVKQIPQAVTYLNQTTVPLRDYLVSKGILSYEAFDELLINLDLTRKLADGGTDALQQVWVSTPKLIGGAINLLLIPLLTWLTLSYWDKIRNFFKYVVPRDIRPIAVYNLQKMNFILWGVVKGQLLVAVILSFLYMLGFSIINLQAGLAIGALAGMFRVVPYLDVIVGASLSIIVVLGQGEGLSMIFGVFVVILIVQALDGMLITPRIIGEKAGLHPVVVIASVVAFGDWFGILGILFAVPSVAILLSIVQMAIPYYLNSPFFRGS